MFFDENPTESLLNPIYLRSSVVKKNEFQNTLLDLGVFSSLPGKCGTVQVLDNVSRMFGKLIPFGIGLAAQAFGLSAAMWLLLAGPIALEIIHTVRAASTPVRDGRFRRHRTRRVLRRLKKKICENLPALCAGTRV